MRETKTLIEACEHLVSDAPTSSEVTTIVNALMRKAPEQTLAALRDFFSSSVTKLDDSGPHGFKVNAWDDALRPSMLAGLLCENAAALLARLRAEARRG